MYISTLTGGHLVITFGVNFYFVGIQLLHKHPSLKNDDLPHFSSPFFITFFHLKSKIDVC